MTVFRMRPILSFVTRNGRGSVAQKKALDTHWPVYGLDCPEIIAPLDVANVFMNPNAPLILEVGFGMGQSLLRQALDMPDTNFIGIEVHLPGVGRLLKGMAEEKVMNLRIFKNNALDVLYYAIPDECVTKVQLFFPDPWPKARHHKRRIVQSGFLDLIAKKLKKGGIFHMATDWHDYAQEVTERLEAYPGLNPVSAAVLADLKTQRPSTKFENRGIHLGHAISDLGYYRC